MLDRKDLWNAMLDADMNTRYWDAIIHSHTRREKIARVVVALLSSGTAASLCLTVGDPWMWKVSSATAAVSAIYLSTWDLRQDIEGMSALRRSWGEFLVDYEKLWVRRKSLTPEDSERFFAIRKDEMNRTVTEAKYPHKDGLLRRCCQAVRKARGL